MMNTLEQKLKRIITDYNKICVAFSGGVDSTLLLYLLAQDKPVVAVIVDGPMVKRSELEEAVAFAKTLPNVTLVRQPIDIFTVPEFTSNTSDRCYHCKKALFNKIQEVAQNYQCDVIVDGSNMDDLSDYRPGLKALKEIGVLSPFVQAGFTKDDIYYLSNFYDLPTKFKPAAACLASRIRTGLDISPEMLNKIEQGENLLEGLGFGQLRLRLISPENGYIEILNDDFNLFYDKLDTIYPALKEMGITIDKKPHLYQQGSMNSEEI